MITIKFDTLSEFAIMRELTSIKNTYNDYFIMNENIKFIANNEDVIKEINIYLESEK